ncbi:MAG: T9SS type A sorting domain-containing protein, partial [Flavobacteriales bacterium]
NNEAISYERLESTINVAPNPANNSAVFSFKAAMTAKTTLELFDLTGQKVADIFMGTVEEGASYNVNFDVSSLATGLYTYRLTNGTDVQIQRLIISK